MLKCYLVVLTRCERAELDEEESRNRQNHSDDCVEVLLKNGLDAVARHSGPCEDSLRQEGAAELGCEIQAHDGQDGRFGCRQTLPAPAGSPASPLSGAHGWSR
jgi:hypothetical protein